jgi:hypothetical protein
MISTNARVVMGTDEMVDDSVSLKVMLQNLGVHNPRWLHKRLKIFASEDPALIERLQKERVSAASKGGVGVDEMQISKSSSPSASNPPSSDEGGGGNKAAPSSSAGSGAADTISDTSSSSIHQHDYNAPSIPDPPVTGKKKSQANNKDSNPSLVSLGSESNSNNTVHATSRQASSSSSSSSSALPPPPKSAVTPSHPPLPKENR